ncbi:MAG: energy transducer TonB [Betaproteobacteria bacterium]|nr:energy transducer TonB [Betaproteobacteria bacterium]
MVGAGEWLAGMERDRVLAMAVGTSIFLHAVLLAVHFNLPDALRWKSESAPLEVVLVNAKTKERPRKADTLAQSNLDRGGNVDDNRRAKTPLPVVEPRNPGRDLAEAQRRVQQLEAQQRRLLAQAREVRSRVASEPPKQAPSETPTQEQNGRDLADLALAAIRLQAQIDKQIQEYQKRPRKKFIGANAAEYRFAQYEEDWRTKVERIGTLNYPAEARGKAYGSLRLTVTVRPDGSVDSIELDRSSGLKILDAAAFKIVRMASPFAVFPPDIARDTDLLVITRTWFFGQGDKIWTE